MALSVEKGSTVEEPAAPPVREDWKFIGWSSDSNIYTAFDFSSPITANTSIYAFFAASAAVTDDKSLPEGTIASIDEETGGYEILPSEEEPSGTEHDIVIPSEINGVPVTRIGNQTFSGRQDIKSVTIPSTVKEIGFQSFNNSSVSEVILSEGVESIGAAAFSNTDIAATTENPLILPDSLTTIGTKAFNSCKELKSIEFGANLQEIESEAFSMSGLEGDLVIPASVKAIEDSAFSICNISKVSFQDGIVLEETGSFIFSNCDSLTDVSLKGLSSVPQSAFAWCDNLTNVDAEGIEKIMDLAFEDCISLTSITNYDSVSELGASAFSGCSSLTEFKGGEALNEIPDNAFENCTSLKTLEFASDNMIIVAENFANIGSDDLTITFSSYKDPGTIENDKITYYIFTSTEGSPLEWPSEERTAYVTHYDNPEGWDPQWDLAAAGSLYTDIQYSQIAATIIWGK